MNYYIVICSSQKHPDCGIAHKWYYDAPSGRWALTTGSAFSTREEAESIAFQLAVKHDDIGQVAVVEQEH